MRAKIFVCALVVPLLTTVQIAEAQRAVKTSTGIKLDWEDTSDNETGFRIYRVTPKGQSKIGEVGANVTTYIDKIPASKSCYVVTAFNSAGESDPSNISCVDDSLATKGEALGGVGSRSVPSQLGSGRRLCDIQLGARALKLLSQVEQTFHKPVRDQWFKEMVPPTAALIASDGTPTVRCNQGSRDLNEEIIAHELYHLVLRASGFPTLEFNGIERSLADWIDYDIYDSIQHSIIYPHLRKLGYSPDARIKRAVERDIADSKSTDKPLPPSDIISRYFRVALESNDPILVDQLTEWYLRRGWDVQLKKARRLVQFIKETNPITPEQAVQLLIKVADVLFEPYLTFQVESWGSKQSGAVLDRHVVIKALPQSVK